MKTIEKNDALMAKREYRAPLCEISLLEAGVVLATVGEASMPSLDFAPARRPGKADNNAPVF